MHASHYLFIMTDRPISIMHPVSCDTMRRPHCYHPSMHACLHKNGSGEKKCLWKQKTPHSVSRLEKKIPAPHCLRFLRLFLVILPT